MCRCAITGKYEGYTCPFEHLYENKDDMFEANGNYYCGVHLPLEYEDGRPTPKMEGWSQDERNENVYNVIEDAYKDVEKGGTLDLRYAVFCEPEDGDIGAKLTRLQFDAHISSRIGKGKYHLYFTGAEFNGPVKFRGTTFSGNVSFEGAEFNGDVSFEKTKFSGDVSFEEAEFSGRVYFEEAEFSGEFVSFEKTKFSGNVFFVGATFSGEFVSFQEATFSGEFVYFKKTTFEHVVYFVGATFSNEVVFFERATFDGKALFVKTTFEHVVYFEGATFNDVIVFSQAKFHGPTHFEDVVFIIAPDFHECALHSDTRFPPIESFPDAEDLKEPDGIKEVIKKLVKAGKRLEDNKFGESITMLSMVSTRLQKLIKSDESEELESDESKKLEAIKRLENVIMRLEENKLSETKEASRKLKEVIKNLQEVASKNNESKEIVARRAIKETSSRYRALAKSMEDIRNREDEATFFILQKRAERCDRQRQASERFASWLYDRLCLYGTSIGRPLICFAGVTAIFWFLYSASFYFSYTTLFEQPSIWSTLGFTTVMTLTPIFKPFDVWAKSYDIGLGWKCISTLQTIATMTFLSFFVLGLRWRFRRW